MSFLIIVGTDPVIYAYITGSVPTMIKKDISTLIFIGLGLMCGILVLNIRNVFSVFLIFSIIIQSLIVMAITISD